MTDKSLKIIFMGTPDFALPSLEVLYNKYDLCAVFCQPDKINARGNKILYGPVKEFALQKNISVYQPETFKNEACLDILKKHNPDLIVVAAYGKILPEYVLDFPKYGCINIHGSLLPKYRGASPIQAAVLNGDKQTGITIMRMSEGLDCGDIIHTLKTDIKLYETAGELFDRLSKLSADCVVEAIEQIISGKATYTKQNDAESSHVAMISKSMGKINFENSARDVLNLIHGLNPWPSAFISCSFGDLKIHRAVSGSVTDKAPATILAVSKNGIEVACGDGKSIVITELQKPGKKKMDAHSFALGTRVQVEQKIFDL